MPKRILVVDDEKAIRELFYKLLSRKGYSVVSAENGKDAFEVLMIEKDEIDLVITDGVMPVMDGEELLQKMAEKKLDIPVILMTGFMEEEKLSRVESSPYWVKTLEKPVFSKDLIGAIEFALIKG